MKTQFDELLDNIQTGMVDVGSIEFSQYNRLQTEKIAKAIRDRLVTERLRMAQEMETETRRAKLNEENLVKIRDAVMRLEGKVILAEKNASQTKAAIDREGARQIGVLRILRTLANKTPEERDTFLAFVANETGVELDGDMDQFESLFEIALAFLAT